MEILAELKKASNSLNKAVYGPGWNRMSFDEFKKSAPPKRERGQADPRPYSWRKKAQMSTVSVQTETETLSETVTTETNTTESRGGGKVKAKKNRMHESRKKTEEEAPVVPSYSLENIRPVVLNPIT